jgi:hypothetical protein
VLPLSRAIATYKAATAAFGKAAAKAVVQTNIQLGTGTSTDKNIVRTETKIIKAAADDRVGLLAGGVVVFFKAVALKAAAKAIAHEALQDRVNRNAAFHSALRSKLTKRREAFLDAPEDEGDIALAIEEMDVAEVAMRLAGKVLRDNYNNRTGQMQGILAQSRSTMHAPWLTQLQQQLITAVAKEVARRASLGRVSRDAAFRTALRNELVKRKDFTAGIDAAIVDSGASSHFVNKHTRLDNPRPAGHRHVSAANGQREPIAEIGDRGCLKELKKVESFGRSLISVSESSPSS